VESRSLIQVEHGLEKPDMDVADSIKENNGERV